MTRWSATPSQDFGTPAADTPFYSNLTYRLKQYAAFAEATWHITDQDGRSPEDLRYYKCGEDKDLLFGGAFGLRPGAGPWTDLCDRHGPQPTYGGCLRSGGVTPASTTRVATSPRLIVSYKPTEEAQLYAQAARGFRLGGINDPINLLLCWRPTARLRKQSNWKDEKTWNYELG